MASVQSHNQPGNAFAEQGEVIMEGPNGIAFSMTPEAAEETARRMMRAAADVRRQSDRGG